MPTLLFEIGTEELPAWYVPVGSDALASAVAGKLDALHLTHGPVHAYATPRRLAVRVEDVAEQSSTREEIRRGPATSAAFDKAGKPTPAATGFAASVGVVVDALETMEGPKGSYLIARRSVGGEAAVDVLADALAAVVAELPAPRKMRWGSIEVPFIRPIAWMVALLGTQVIPVTQAGVAAGRATRGHRFLHPAPIELANADAYEAALATSDVIASRAARADAVRQAVAEAAKAEGGVAAAPESLVDEVVDLVERPFAVVGAFDEGFLALPDEVLTTVMIHHQRFVPVRDAAGKLQAKFVAIANHRVPDPALVRGGYQRVLAGRLHDARFFWDADRSKSLSQHAWALSGIAFQKQLGTMADKVARASVGAQAIARTLGMGAAELQTLEAALPLYRADLATDMVGELPELEGTMARAYALADGAPELVAQALEDGVLPRGPNDGLPQSRVGAVLAVADRIDKLLGFFALGKRPSGSADPFALRRDAVALARTLNAQGWRVPLRQLVESVAEAYADGPVTVDATTIEAVVAFIWDRVSALLAEEGVRTPVVRAAVAASAAVVGATRRAHLLQALEGQPAVLEIQALYKRAANLAEHAPEGFEVDAARFEDDAERNLWTALPAAREGAQRLIEAMHAQIPAWDLGARPQVDAAALAPLAAEVLALKAPLDAFLDGVMVMVEDDAVRANRLTLLAAVASTVRTLGALEHLGG